MIRIAVIASFGVLCGISAEVPLVAPVLAHSSQYFIQNHNALIAPYAAPYITPYTTPYISPYVASYVTPVVAQTAVAPSPVQPPTTATVQPRPVSPNPDAETVEVESARVKSLQNVKRPTQEAKRDFRVEKQRQTAAPGLLSSQRLVQEQLFV
ncbi:uncharacterized protein [Euwallacea fornicatus]|uniref:uncharacterized protein n=1 Tax=Euwallacea fornicatus TaxID=995702 RepID=UPI00338D6A3F